MKTIKKTSNDPYKQKAIEICESLGLDPFQMCMTDVYGPLTRPEAQELFGHVVHDILLQEPQWALYREQARQLLLIEEQNTSRR
jgi:hypothetical protein